MKEPSILNRFIQNASLLFLLQIFAKVTTFTLNFFSARFVQKEVYGYANIQLQLYYSTILFFSKEALRRTCQRQVLGEEEGSWEEGTLEKSAKNLVLKTLWVQVALAVLTFGAVNYFYFEESMEKFTLCLGLTCFSAVIENLCEPFYVAMLQKQDFSIRVKAEGVAIFLKSVLLYFLILWELSLLSFALSQLAYSSALFLVYFIQDYRSSPVSPLSHFSLHDLGPPGSQEPLYVLEAHKKDLREFLLVCGVKYLLTEGEKVIIAFANNFSLQLTSELSLVANLVSLVCRFFFQPVEEISFNMFSRMSKQKPLYIYAKFLQMMAVVGVGIVAGGLLFSEIFLRVMYTEKWATASAVSIMHYYCVYCLFMGLNGVTEAYTYSLAPKDILRQQQGYLLLTSIVYFLCCAFFSQAIGIEGLIVANCANMGLRIVTSLLCIVKMEADGRKVSKKEVAWELAGYVGELRLNWKELKEKYA